MTPGPLQILVVNFDDPDFRGEIAAELERLEQAGTLRVLDLVIVRKTEDGQLETLDVDMLDEHISWSLLGIDESEAPEHGDQDEVWHLADALEPGATAAVAVVEHLWALPLRAAIERAGGRPAAAEWIDPEELAGLGIALGSA
jgi:Family of unknown function (DUF6325)